MNALWSHLPSSLLATTRAVRRRVACSKRKRILLYTDSRGRNIPYKCNDHLLEQYQYDHYPTRLGWLHDVDEYLMPEKWTTILDFLELSKQLDLSRYDCVVLHAGAVDAAPRQRPVLQETIYPQKKRIFDEVFGEVAARAHIAAGLGVAYEGDETANMYSLEMAQAKLIPRLLDIDNLVFVGGNRIVAGWRGNYWKDRPSNIALIEDYFSLFACKLPRVVDLMGWTTEEVKRNTFDNIHLNQRGSDIVFESLAEWISRA